MAITLSLSDSQANRLAGLLSEEIFKIDAEINVLKDELLKKEEERRGVAHMISTINANAVAAPAVKPTAQRTAPAAKMQQAVPTPTLKVQQQQTPPVAKTPAAPIKKQQRTEEPSPINEVPKYTLDPEDTGRDRSF